jgi:hypothetical protein
MVTAKWRDTDFIGSLSGKDLQGIKALMFMVSE